MRQVAMALAAACLLMNTVSAQTFGGITGEVKDSSGAIMPSVAITVTNTGTNAARSVVTNASGIYNVPDLVPGTYQIKVSASGFQQMVSTVEIQVQQVARVDFTLTVGQATQTIEVSASAASLTTENATVGTVIENQRINDLPLNGRDYFQLVALSPNVNYGFAAAAQASGREGGTRATITISQIGERATWQYYSLDGVTNTDIDFNLYIVLPSVDALQEFKVQSGVYPAEFGREAGQVNVATKPGTNDFHGTAFEFLRNDALDAKPYDFVPPVPAKQPYRQNQYGFTVGGPIWIPKLFNGKNKLFFMSNFEGFKTRLTTAALATTLPAAMRAGDFSSLKNITLLDPATRVQNGNGSYSASPFSNNQIPTSRINPQTLQLLAYDPLPNEPSQSATQPFANYLYNANTPVNKNQVTERIDFNESTNSQWFGRYSWTGENGLTPGITSNDGSTLVTHANQWVVSNTRVFSSTKVNEARFGYSSIFNQIGQQLAGVTNVDAAIGVPVSLPTGNLWGIPNVSLTNSLTSFGNPTNGPYVIDDKYYQWMDNFSWIHGKHSFRFGGEYRRDRFPSFGNEFTRGQFTFSGDYTGNPNTLAGGYSGADLMLGAPSTVNMAVSAAQTNYEAGEAALYLDDTYKVTNKLTLTLGLRWEVEQPLRDDDKNEVTELLRENLPNYQLCVPNCGNPNVQNLALHPLYVRAGTDGNFWEGINFIIPGLQSARDGQLGSRLIHTNWNNFAPRIGVAFSPTTKWVVRAGFGIFYSQESKNSIFDLNRNLSGRATISPSVQTAPTIDYQNFLNSSQLPIVISPAGLTWGANPHLPTTYSMVYVFNVQRQFGSGTTLEVGYNGVQDRHTDLIMNENQPVPGVSPFSTRAPYAELNAIQYVMADGIGNYNGASVKLTQRLNSGLTVLAGYTFSKALDDSSAIRGTAADFAPENALCRSCDYGPSAFNVPNRLVASVLYALPVGRGKRFLNRGGIVNQILAGWNASGILTIQSGAALDTSSWDAAGVAILPSSNRLNCLGVNPYVANPNPNSYLNMADFSNAVATPLSYSSFGNCGRNNLMGPRTTNLDFSLLKDFRVTERQRLQVRVEMFNAANHPEFSPPSATWGTQSGTPSASFGLIRSSGTALGTVTTMREIQFAMKYIF
jgi:hypothetical protein